MLRNKRPDGTSNASYRATICTTGEVFQSMSAEFDSLKGTLLLPWCQQMLQMLLVYVYVKNVTNLQINATPARNVEINVANVTNVQINVKNV